MEHRPGRRPGEPAGGPPSEPSSDGRGSTYFGHASLPPGSGLCASTEMQTHGVPREENQSSSGGKTPTRGCSQEPRRNPRLGEAEKHRHAENHNIYYYI